MLGLENVVCCSSDYYAEPEEVHPQASVDIFVSHGTFLQEPGLTLCKLVRFSDECVYAGPIFSEDIPLFHPLDSVSTRESALKEEQDEYAVHCPPTHGYLHIAPILNQNIQRPDWLLDAPLQGQLSVLNDWATALGTQHARGVVHGNLTPESVDVVHGKGVLINQGWQHRDLRSPCPALNTLANHGFLPSRDRKSWVRVPSDDDVYSARWAASELFRLDNGNLTPTKMSDVYSFACLMLQMLTGSVPYCGTRRPEQVVYLKYLGREPIDAQTPKVADRYVVFMRWCWSPEPEKRPTMETVAGFIHEEIRRLGDLKL